MNELMNMEPPVEAPEMDDDMAMKAALLDELMAVIDEHRASRLPKAPDAVKPPIGM